MIGGRARLPSEPGDPVLLHSDQAGTDPLAADIAPGGRLDGLLGALEQAVPPGSPLGAAVCVAFAVHVVPAMAGDDDDRSERCQLVRELMQVAAPLAH